jgi:hypothetical protein
MELLLITWLQGASIALQVQFVDPGWLQVPGITFYVQRVSSCAEPVKASDPKRLRATTKAPEGVAIVPAQHDAYYRITFDGEGGFKPINKCIHLGSSQPPEPKAYVQIQIQIR